METNETISTAALHLLVKIEDDGIFFATFNPLEDDTFKSCKLRTSQTKGVSVDDIKDLIYDNPVLLHEYARTYIMVDSHRFTFVPVDIEPNEENCLPYYDYCFPEHSDYVVNNSMTMIGAYSLFGMEHELYAFLCRTFSNPIILHPLTPLCEYFVQHSRNGNEAKVYLYLSGSRLYVMAFKQGRLLLANVFDANTAENIAYYTLSVYKHLSLDQERDRIYITGDKNLRQSLMTILQEYVRSVLPYPFPSQLFRIGKETIDAPFELVTIPLCAL